MQINELCRHKLRLYRKCVLLVNYFKLDIYDSKKATSRQRSSSLISNLCTNSKGSQLLGIKSNSHLSVTENLIFPQFQSSSFLSCFGLPHHVKGNKLCEPSTSITSIAKWRFGKPEECPCQSGFSKLYSILNVSGSPPFIAVIVKTNC